MMISENEGEAALVFAEILLLALAPVVGEMIFSATNSKHVACGAK